MKTILIVDDQPNILKVMKANLSHHGYRVITAHSAHEAWSYIQKEPALDMVITDYKLNGMNGIELLKKIRSHNPVIPVLIITAYGNIENAVEAMKAGANNYLTKPLDYDEMLTIIQHTLQVCSHGRQMPPKEEWQKIGETVGIVAESQVMREIIEQIQLVSRASSNILILGESGTGKELVARAIHNLSERKEEPFIPVDCAAIPSELIENELFGHEKGAYTGAFNSDVGKIEMAGEGTLFLDEIGEMPRPLQAKLLRVLQEREFFKIAGKELKKMRCRVIAATNRDLEKDVEEGLFREDLFYRLNVISIKLPPLRERKEDILPLAYSFLQTFSKLNNKPLQGFDRAVIEIFLHYDWPGNVRELKNCVERAVVMSRYDTIVIDNLPRRLQKLAEQHDHATPLTDNLHLPSLERSAILQALEKANWNQTRAAQILGISRKQLRTKMKNLDLI